MNTKPAYIFALILTLIAALGCSDDESSPTNEAEQGDTSLTQDSGAAEDSGVTMGDVAQGDDVGAEDTSQDTATVDATPDTTVEMDVAEDVAPDTVEDTRPNGPPLLEEYVFEGEEDFPESVAFDPVDRAFYTGSLSLGNVLRTDADGTQTEFFPGNVGEEDWLVLGLEVDIARRELWVCAAFGVGFLRSEIWRLDLETGERLWRGSLEGVYQGAACIDVTVDSDGIAYVADRQAGNIYRIEPTEPNATIDIIVNESPLLTPDVIGQNGITLSEDEKYLLTAKFSAPELTRISLENPRDIQVIDLAANAPRPLRSLGADALVILDGVVYIAMDSELLRVVPNADWTAAEVDIHTLTRANGSALTGVSGLAAAEGALYVSKGDVIGFAVSLPGLPFLLRRVETRVFEE